MSRPLLRIGSLSLMAGAILALGFNLLHPRTAGVADVEAVLPMIADSAAWDLIHAALLLGVLLIVAGLVAVERSIREGAAAAWARLGTTAAALSGAVYLVLSAVDGRARKVMAEAWLRAPPPERMAALRVSEALEMVNFGLFSVFGVVFFGLTFMLFGLAIVKSDVYPRVLGWVALIGGIVSFLVGSTHLLRGPSVLMTNILFTASSIILTALLFVIGALLWRRVSVTAPQPTYGERVFR